MGSLTWHTQNGFDVKPFYTGENTENRKPIFEFSDWDICEPIDVHDVKFANHQALQALKKGASGLVFNINNKIETTTLLKNISLEHIYSQFNISNDALHILTDLKNIHDLFSISRSQTLTSPSVRAKKRIVKPIKSRWCVFRIRDRLPV